MPISLAATHDPQRWADVIFRSPSRWVGLLLGIREALVRLVGIDRGGTSAFGTLASTNDEVLVGINQNHLNFRASVKCETYRVVLTTIVQIHNRRGRVYSAVVRRIHPVIVRSMLNGHVPV